MTEHLPECHLMQPCGADTPKHGFCSRQQTWCIHCERECICDRLQACEARVTALATPESVAQAMYWWQEGQRDALAAAVQRVGALPHALECVTRDPNYKRPCNCLHGDALDAIKGDPP